MKYWIVWNEDKTVGFITNDEQLAYECRKGSDTNCNYEDGTQCHTAIAFTDEFLNHNCTKQEIEIQI